MTKQRLKETAEALELSINQRTLRNDITPVFINEIQNLVMDLLDSLESKDDFSNEANNEMLIDRLIETAAICDAILSAAQEIDRIFYFSAIRSHLRPQLQNITLLLD